MFEDVCYISFCQNTFIPKHEWNINDISKVSKIFFVYRALSIIPAVLNEHGRHIWNVLESCLIVYISKSNKTTIGVTILQENR